MKRRSPDTLRFVSQLDADGALSLDIHEMTPYFEAAFVTLFGIDLSPDQDEALFHLMDTVQHV